MTRALTALVSLLMFLIADATHATCVDGSLRQLGDQLTERRLQTSPLRPDRVSGMSGNGARFEVLDDGTRVVTKPSMVTHHRGQVRSGDYEIAAGLVDRQLGLNSAPLIVEREVDGARRTVQLFVDDAQLGGSSTWNPDELGFFDYLIRNQDRNYMNYMNQGGRPVAIDNAFSFTNVQLVNRELPDYPRIVRDLASRAGSSASARSRLQTLLPNQAAYDALRNTTPAQWRTLLRDRLNEEEIVSFLERREEILRAVADARRTVGDDVMRAGNEPARFADQPGRMRTGGGPFDYVPSAPRSGQEAASELNRSGRISRGSGNLEPGRTYQVGILRRNGQVFIGDRLTEGSSATGSIRITPDGVVEISGNAAARSAIGIELRTILPPGTTVRPVNRFSVAARRVTERVAAARAPAVEAAGQRSLQRTVSRFTNARTFVRDGGFRGSIVNGPPEPGNYVLVNVRTVNRGGQPRDQLTLIRESGDVGPGATVRRVRADGEDYLPGHRTSVGNVTIGPRGEVTLVESPMSNPGDIEVLNQRLRSIGIRPN